MALVPRNRATTVKSPVQTADSTTVSAPRLTRKASSLVPSTRSRCGRHSSRFAIPPLFHSAPTKDAPTTNPTTASSAASAVTRSGKFFRKSKVGGVYQAGSKSLSLGGAISLQSAGYCLAFAVPCAASQAV